MDVGVEPSQKACDELHHETAATEAQNRELRASDREFRDPVSEYRLSQIRKDHGRLLCIRGYNPVRRVVSRSIGQTHEILPFVV